MDKLKAGLLTVAGAAIGFLTLRTLRQRRTAPEGEEEPDVETIRTEAQAAVEHATTAASHARTAGEQAVGYVETGIDEMRTTATDNGDEPERMTPVRRLRRVGKGWIRR